MNCYELLNHFKHSKRSIDSPSTSQSHHAPHRSSSRSDPEERGHRQGAARFYFPMRGKKHQIWSTQLTLVTKIGSTKSERVGARVLVSGTKTWEDQTLRLHERLNALSKPINGCCGSARKLRKPNQWYLHQHHRLIDKQGMYKYGQARYTQRKVH